MARRRNAYRQAAYEAIDTERDYQDSLPRTRTDGRVHTVGEFVAMLNYYIHQANEAWTKNPGDAAALEVIRKMAGICVHCMEKWGSPKRQNQTVKPLANISPRKRK